ncbi:type II toxin-antitoxin system VapC family toxin [Desulfobacter sp.]|uniref:type II toxin-antitoxin system VapC family toxin n=1 Tax=Desulfobacter sp. TaxID=2294 RepID=UPI003D0F3095
MKVLFDTNIILDVMLDRLPFSGPASMLMSLVEKKELAGSICATTVTTIYYLTAKAFGKNNADKHIQSLMSLFEIAPVNESVLYGAIKAKFNDFEDAVIYQSAENTYMDAIITRNLKDFKVSKLPVYSPDEMLQLLKVV